MFIQPSTKKQSGQNDNSSIFEATKKPSLITRFANLILLFLFAILGLISTSQHAFSLEPTDPLTTIERKSTVSSLSGPRIGVTYLSPGETANVIDTNFISQYGWQAETKIASGNNFNGLIEWVFLAGGIEQGMFLPSISSLMGIRFDTGTELAFGPNLSLSGVSMVLAAGRNFTSGDINIPVNISWVPSHDDSGHRVSLTVGFNVEQKKFQ
jgi:hypothetical protein